MDKAEFQYFLEGTKNLFGYSRRFEKKLLDIDFFAFYNELMPIVFHDTPKELIQKEEFKLLIWRVMLITMSIHDQTTPKKADPKSNIINFDDYRARLLA